MPKGTSSIFSDTMKTISFIFCLCYACTLTDGAIINVEGFEGRNVSFQCKHKIASNSNKYFCKDPCKSEGEKLVTVESGRRAESGRITLVDSGDGSFNVTFSHLQLSDSQKYWCGVDRLGFDTYTKVQLTVKKAVETETTLVPDVSSTSTFQNINTPHFTTGPGTMKHTEVSAAFTTEAEPKISGGTIICATVGGVGLIAILLLTVCFRKSRKASKHEVQVYCSSIELSNANETEGSCGYAAIDKKTKCSNKSSESSSACTHQQRQDPPTSEPLCTYENITFPKLPACSGHSPAEENDYDINTGIYITPLPAFEYERTGDGTCGNHTRKHNICFSNLPTHSENSPTEDQNDYDIYSAIYMNPLPDIMYDTTDDGTCRDHTPNPKTCKNTESPANSASPCVSRAPCESSEDKPGSRWFGLNLSGTNQS
ncbi:unnamed protein product [Oreochromis niloticus]|nr:unnamed protein product [Mustela putorius furo]